MAHGFRILVLCALLLQGVIGVVRPRCDMAAAREMTCACCTEGEEACGMDDSEEPCGCASSTRHEEPGPAPAAPTESRTVSEFVPSRPIGIAMVMPVERCDAGPREAAPRTRTGSQALLCVWRM